MGEFVGHLHVFKHHFESLCELESTLFLQFEHKSSLCIFTDVSLIQEPLSEAIYIESFEDIFIQQIAEDLYNLVNPVDQFVLLDRLEIFLEHLIEVKDESLGCAIACVDHLLKGHFDRQVDGVISLHGFDMEIIDPFS